MWHAELSGCRASTCEDLIARHEGCRVVEEGYRRMHDITGSSVYGKYGFNGKAAAALRGSTLGCHGMHRDVKLHDLLGHSEE